MRPPAMLFDPRCLLPEAIGPLPHSGISVLKSSSNATHDGVVGRGPARRVEMARVGADGWEAWA